MKLADLEAAERVVQSELFKSALIAAFGQTRGTTVDWIKGIQRTNEIALQLIKEQITLQ